MEGVDGAGAVRVAHELVDVAAPGLLGVVAGRGLKGGQDGREEGRGRGRDAPLAFSKAAKKGHDHVRRRRPSPRGRGSPACPVPPRSGGSGDPASAQSLGDSFLTPGKPSLPAECPGFLQGCCLPTGALGTPGPAAPSPPQETRLLCLGPFSPFPSSVQKRDENNFESVHVSFVAGECFHVNAPQKGRREARK